MNAKGLMVSCCVTARYLKHELAVRQAVVNTDSMPNNRSIVNIVKVDS